MEKVYIKNKQGDKVLPVTHVSAVLDDQGNDVGSIIGTFEDEVRGLVDTPHQNYVTVSATNSTTAATDVLPGTGQSADTIYRVANWDGSTNSGAGSFDVTKYSEYAWDDVSAPAKYVFLCVKSQIDEVFDITVYNSNTKYADLAAALGTNGANIPQTLRRGGMSVKYVQSYDNKYVQYRYMLPYAGNTTAENTKFVNVGNWQGVDSKLVPDSKNLVTSGGVLSEEASHLSSIFARPALTKRSRIKKDGTYQTGNYTTYTTKLIPIQEGADVFVWGIITTDATPVAFYSTNAQSSFIQAELNNNYVHYSAEELSAMGAKYLRCTIGLEQVESGDWFVIASNIEKSVDDIITDIFSPDIKIDTARGCFTIDILYLHKFDGSREKIYANGDSSEHSPVTYTFNISNLICVLSKNKTIEMRTNLGDVLADDIILLTYAAARYFYGGALYKYVANSVKNVYRNDVKTEELIDGGSLSRTGGKFPDSNYITDFLEIKEGCGIAVKAWGSSGVGITSRAVICFYSDASIDSFITCFSNSNEFTISYNELVAIGAKYFRCSISAEQVENGDWYIQYLSVKEISDDAKNKVSFLPQDLTIPQKVQVKNNIDAADKFFEQPINLLVLTISHNIINSDNNWYYYTSKYNAVFVPITAGEHYHVHADLQTVVAVLTSDVSSVPNPVTTFATGFEGRIIVTANNDYSFTCPEDGHYLYVLTKGNSGELNPSVYKNTEINEFLEDVVEEINTIKENNDTLYNEVSSKRRIADSIGNSLTPLSIPVDESGYEIPTTREVLNVQKKAKQMTDIVWTPLADIPYHGTGGVFPANVPVTGLPYSSVKEIDKYIGFDVSIHTFMTALNNPYSLLYTECVLGTRSASAWGKTYHGVDGVACYMGTVCSVLSGYGSGQVIQWPTAEDRWCAERNLNMAKVFNQSAQGLHIGDIIWISGHNRLVVGLKRDSDGNVTHVQITESTGSHVRQNNDITAVTFDNNLATERGGGIIYRNTELYKNTYTPSEFVAVGDETITPYVYNDDICTFAGNKACFRENDLIVINYDLKNSNTAWTAIEVYKDDVLLETYNIADIDQSELPEGQRNHALKLGSEHTYGMYKARLTDGTNYSDYTYWEVIQTDVTFVKNDSIHHIEWGSENGVPLSFTICNINGTVYAHNELAIEDVRNGYIDLDLVKFNKQQYPSKAFTANMYLKIHFEGQYGRVTNEPFIIKI